MKYGAPDRLMTGASIRVAPVHCSADHLSPDADVGRELRICSALVKQRFPANAELLGFRFHGLRRERGRPHQRRVVVDVGLQRLTFADRDGLIRPCDVRLSLH